MTDINTSTGTEPDLSELEELVRAYGNTPLIGPGRTRKTVMSQIKDVVGRIAAKPVPLNEQPGELATDTELIDRFLTSTGADETLHRSFGRIGSEISRRQAALSSTASITKSTPVTYDELAGLLRTLVLGDTGQGVLWKLSRGQSTETVEGKAWLAAKEIVAGMPPHWATTAEQSDTVSTLNKASSMADRAEKCAILGSENQCRDLLLEIAKTGNDDALCAPDQAAPAPH